MYRYKIVFKTEWIFRFYSSNALIAYAWIQPFRDGYVIKTIGVKSAYKGKGFGSLMYDKLIEIGKIYSDLNQTP